MRFGWLGLELEKVHGDPVSYASRQNIYLSNVLGYSNESSVHEGSGRRSKQQLRESRQFLLSSKGS